MTATILAFRPRGVTPVTLCDGTIEHHDADGFIVPNPGHAARRAALTDAPDRDETIAIIRVELRRRTGRTWTVEGGTGTAWGWITVTAPPKRRGGKWGPMTGDDRRVLADALGLAAVGDQGEQIPAQADYRVEYVARARGEKPAVTGTPGWD